MSWYTTQKEFIRIAKKESKYKEMLKEYLNHIIDRKEKKLNEMMESFECYLRTDHVEMKWEKSRGFQGIESIFESIDAAKMLKMNISYILYKSENISEFWEQKLGPLDPENDFDYKKVGFYDSNDDVFTYLHGVENGASNRGEGTFKPFKDADEIENEEWFANMINVAVELPTEYKGSKEAIELEKAFHELIALIDSEDMGEEIGEEYEEYIDEENDEFSSPAMVVFQIHSSGSIKTANVLKIEETLNRITEASKNICLDLTINIECIAADKIESGILSALRFEKSKKAWEAVVSVL